LPLSGNIPDIPEINDAHAFGPWTLGPWTSLIILVSFGEIRRPCDGEKRGPWAKGPWAERARNQE